MPPALTRAYDAVPSGKYAVLRFHPDTLDHDDILLWMSECVDKCYAEGWRAYYLPPNNDTGWEEIAEHWHTLEDAGRVTRLTQLPRPQYLGIIEKAEWVAGNSSSFVLEVPAINSRVEVFGSRQRGRQAPTKWVAPPMAQAVYERVINGQTA
jgi:UDP-N-acetylglucosamine 2-epimerase